MQSTTNSRSYRFKELFYFLAGGAAGAATALLLAPKSGTEFRRDLAASGRRSLDGTFRTVRDLKERSLNAYNHLTDHLIEVKTDLVHDLMPEAEAVDGKSPNATVTPAPPPAATRPGNGGRRPSSIV
ncbi:MAG: YtxH domain-containing protein [Pyrinomonadaceae bacterium]|nr:YtxH domain-containing protein [Pyrinomonadaceae bacterium]